MIAFNEHNSEPLTELSLHGDMQGLEAELAAFNKEAIEIIVEGETIRPESEAFAEAGLGLEELLQAGLENLREAELAHFVTQLNKMQSWRACFEPRVNALLARQARHLEHEKSLMQRLKERNLIVDLVPTSPFSAN